MLFKKKYPKWFSEINNIRPAKYRNIACKAPDKSMYFRIDGRVTLCCHNWSYKIGIFPQQSLLQIWNSKEKQYLKDKLASFDFSAGCYRCQMNITSGNIHATGLLDYDIYKRESKYPEVLEFELDAKCNINCIMCTRYLHDSLKNNFSEQCISKEIYNDDFLNQLKEIIPHISSAKFYGGEPFFIEIYYKIWELILELNPACSISLQTNGTIFNDSIQKLLQKGKFNIGVSIDSIKKETYETIRRGAGFENVIKNLNIFREYCLERKTFFGVSICPIKFNRYEIPEIMAYFDKLNVPVFLNTVLLPPSQALWTLSYNELTDYVNFLKQEYEKLKSDLLKETNSVYLDFIKLVEQWKSKSDLREKEKNRLNEYDQGSIKSFLLKKIEKILISEQQRNDLLNENIICDEVLKFIPLQQHKTAMINLILLEDFYLSEIIKDDLRLISDFILQF